MPTGDGIDADGDDTCCSIGWSSGGKNLTQYVDGILNYLRAYIAGTMYGNCCDEEPDGSDDDGEDRKESKFDRKEAR